MGLTTYWYSHGGVFRPELCKEDSLPVGYRRAQCFRKVYDGPAVATHTEARRLAWPVLSPDDRARAIESLTWTIENTGIYGDARKTTEAALAWLGSEVQPVPLRA